MCQVTRREFLAGGAGVLSLAEMEERAAQKASGSVEQVDPLAPGVYFHEGDLQKKGHCNNGWILLEDFVLVIDANFPSGAQEILPKIRALTQKPIRFAFDTHHHGDHAYGNQVWVENGATPVAHTGVAEEMKKYEPDRWNETARSRPDVAASSLKAPSVLFPRELYFDDGKQRVELIHLGVAHTHGDAWAWLPKQRILFGGDACVNGPYNFVGDGNVEKWIGTLEAARKLGARILCPGHGPRGSGMVVEDQQAFFKSLREVVGARVRLKRSPDQVKAAVREMKAELQANRQIARYVGDFFAAQAEKVYAEMTGKTFPASGKTALRTRHWHAHQHGTTRAV